MMEALLAREYELKEDSKIDIQKLNEGERGSKKEKIRSDSGGRGKETFQVFLEQAVQFCNGNSQGALDLKEHIREM